MKKFFFITLFFVSLFGNEKLSAQETIYRLVSYNVENLFDYKNDSLTNDDEFTPQGSRAWNYEKYQKKLGRISKVIAAINDGQPPFAIGLCEIENARVLTDLTKYSPLKAMNYQFVHFDSPDRRGIDTGLLYQRTLFLPFHNEAIAVRFNNYSDLTTRDILYVAGIFCGTDTLHLFVCHFPSRLGGELESESKRCDAAATLKAKTDSISNCSPNAKIIIMGDFNDYPDNKSMSEILQAKLPKEDEIKPNLLYNLTKRLEENPNIGTHKHQAEWGILDQIIVSGALLIDEKGITTTPFSANIFSPDFLLENDEKYLYKKPFRTYVGFKYNNGFSDHLPIYLDLNYTRK